MKVKEVVKGFPAKKDNSGCENKKQLCPFCKENDGYNQALEEVGNLEIDEEVSKLLEEKDKMIEELKYNYVLKDIPKEERCEECSGAGEIAYANTSTYNHGIGGQMITSGVCDKCWGSGNKNNPWRSWKEINEIYKLNKQLKDSCSEKTLRENGWIKKEEIVIKLETKNGQIPEWAWKQALEQWGEKLGYVKLSEIDLRELIDEEKLTNIIAKTTSKTNTLEDMKIAKAIKEQANELVNHDK